MAKVDVEFHRLCNEILNNGREYLDTSRGVKRLQIPSYTFKHSFSDGFPAISNKKLYWKGLVGELLWFLRGDTDIKYLCDNGIKIWNQDAYNWHVKQGGELSFEEFEKLGEGSVGLNYSKQWRDFGGIDQIANLIKAMNHNIMDSRLIVSAWNPAELDKTALPPCHNFFQVVGVPLTLDERVKILKEVSYKVWYNNAISQMELACNVLNIPKFGFELHWNQRSVDTFLGLPFNIASYATLAQVLESLTGYKAMGIEGNLHAVHFYENQIEAVKEMLQRDPNAHKNCLMKVDTPFRNLDGFLKTVEISDFQLIGYTSDSEIKVKMMAPIKI